MMLKYLQSLMNERLQPQDDSSQRGQSIVLIALALIGLLAFVGIAVDVGFVFARSSQLQAAVDAAALAGIVELASDPDDSTPANQKAEQFLHTNGFDIEVDIPGAGLLGKGQSLGVTDLGATQYELVVDLPVDLFFLKLIGRDAVTLTREAVAGIFPMADIYVSRRIEDGVISTSNQAVFGPKICTSYGDAFSPLNSPWAAGLYTYEYRILIPSEYPEDIVRVELFDPDSINKDGVTVEAQHTNLAVSEGMPLFENLSCTGGDANRKNPCVLDTGEADLGLPIDRVNPYWFIRIDENRGTGGGDGNGSCGSPPNYDTDYNTQTTYHLFYWAQNSDGTLRRVDLATYTGQVGDNNRDNGDHLTDMQWVSPGGSPNL